MYDLLFDSLGEVQFREIALILKRNILENIKTWKFSVKTMGTFEFELNTFCFMIEP